jgi:hypothetical protein
MRWPARIIASGRRMSAEHVYRQARLHAAGHLTLEPAWWWGACSTLSHHQLHHGILRPTGNLWAELLPFLFMRDEAAAGRAVVEYLVYLEDPRLADLELLGVEINRALEGADTFDASIAALLQSPMQISDAPWMALLSYQTLLRVRRAVDLYGERPPYPGRATFWHGLPAIDDE